MCMLKPARSNKVAVVQNAICQEQRFSGTIALHETSSVSQQESHSSRRIGIDCRVWHTHLSKRFCMRSTDLMMRYSVRLVQHPCLALLTWLRVWNSKHDKFPKWRSHFSQLLFSASVETHRVKWIRTYFCEQLPEWRTQIPQTHPNLQDKNRLTTTPKNQSTRPRHSIFLPAVEVANCCTALPSISYSHR